MKEKIKYVLDLLVETEQLYEAYGQDEELFDALSRRDNNILEWQVLGIDEKLRLILNAWVAYKIRYCLEDEQDDEFINIIMDKWNLK